MAAPCPLVGQRPMTAELKKAIDGAAAKANAVSTPFSTSPSLRVAPRSVGRGFVGYEFGFLLLCVPARALEAPRGCAR
jgi:hypothetical protein